MGSEPVNSKRSIYVRCQVPQETNSTLPRLKNDMNKIIQGKRAQYNCFNWIIYIGFKLTFPDTIFS